MNTIYCINALPYKESNATALDNDFAEKYMCIGSPCSVSIVESEKYTATPRNIRTNRHDVHLIRWQRFRDSGGTHIVSASTQFFDVYTANNDSLNLLGSSRAHPFNLTDLDWCVNDPNALLSCSIDDAVKSWDLRDLRRPYLQLPVIGGAEQAKWAPLNLNLLSTSHGTDVRLWDNRNLSLPVQSISAHVQKISCLTWHPTISTCFLTAGLDGYIKMWNSTDLTKPRHSLGMLPAPVWKIKFSNNGSEFASIPVPPYGESEENGALSLWKTSNLDIVQVIKCEDDVLLDLCWQKLHMQRQTYSCLYSVSRYGKLRKYNLPPSEDSPEVDMETSYASRVDENMEDAFVLDEEIKISKSNAPNSSENAVILSPTGNKDRNGIANSEMLRRQKVEIIENKLCLTVSKRLDDLIMELASLKRMCRENLTVEQADNMHCALTWNRDASSRFRIKVVLSLQEGAENNSSHVIIEIVQEESCLSTEEIEVAVKKLLNESAATVDVLQSNEPILPVILQKFQDILNSMKAFTPRSLDIPLRPESVVQFCNGASFESGPHSVTLETISAVVPKSTLSSPPLSTSYDRWIPSPRTCGARFNGSGLLVVFGRNEFAMRRMQSSKGSFQDESLWLSAERITMAIKSTSLKKGPLSFLGDGHDAVIGTPRSLDEYKHDLLLSSEDMHTRLQNLSAYEKCTSPLYQSASGTPIIPSNMALLHQKMDPVNSRTSSQQGMHTSNSMAILCSTRSNSMQNVRSHRRRGNSGTNVLADDHHHLDDGAPVSVVVIYDVSVLMSVSKDLAREYRLLDADALELCLWNRKAVERAGRKDLERVWQIVELCVRLEKSNWRKYCTLDKNNTLTDVMTDSDSSEENMSEEESFAIAVHPFGRSLVNSLLDYFARINDYQTAAVIICILGMRNKHAFEFVDDDNMKLPTVSRRIFHHGRSISTCGDSPGGSVHNTIHANARLGSSFRLLQQQEKEKEKQDVSEQAPPAPVTVSASKPTRKLSALLQNAFIGHRVTQTPKTEQNNGESSGCHTPNTSMISSTTEQPQCDKKAVISENKSKFSSLLDPAYSDRFDEVRHQYADLLFRWRMFSKAAEVMKYSERAPPSPPLLVRSACPQCNSKRLRFRCDKCGVYWKFLCSLCQLPVLGVLTVCAVCGHGGHSEHMALWFKENDHCAYGCGCDCKSACF